MRVRGAVAALAAIASIGAVPVSAQTPANAPLTQRLVDTASRFCIDILSRDVPVPTVGSSVYARYGLAEGLPQDAMTALGREGVNLIARATLASGTSEDGAFIVALGGAAGGTCRLIVYRAPRGGVSDAQIAERMLAKPAGWRSVPAPSLSTTARKQSFFKRDNAKRPYLANVLSSVTAGPIALTVTVTPIPPNITLPQGY